MKFGQLIEHNKINIFLQKLCRNRGRVTSSRPLFVFWKSLIWGEGKWTADWFQYISIALSLPYNKNWAVWNFSLSYNKNKMYNFKLLIQRYAQLSFFRKGSGNSFSTTFCLWFFKKMFFMLHSINWPNFIAWLPLLLEILGNICIKIVC